VVPGFLKGFAAVDANVEDEDRAARFPGEHDRAGLGDVTWAAGAVDREGAIDSFFQAASHDGEATQAAT